MKRRTIAITLVFSLFLTIILTSMLGYIPIASAATVYDSSITVDANDAGGANLNANGQVRYTNTVNGSVHGWYTLSSTGTHTLSGVGNATKYKIEIKWYGTIVSTGSITTSATAASSNSYSINCGVYRVSVKNIDANNYEFKGTIKVTAPNGTVKTFTSISNFTQAQAQNGTWKIEAYWQGTSWKVNVTSINLQANKAFNIICHNLWISVGGTGYDTWMNQSATTIVCSWEAANKRLRIEGSASAGTYVTIYAYIKDVTCRDVYCYSGSLISWSQSGSIVTIKVKATSPIVVELDLSTPIAIKPPPTPPPEEEEPIITLPTTPPIALTRTQILLIIIALLAIAILLPEKKVKK